MRTEIHASNILKRLVLEYKFLISSALTLCLLNKHYQNKLKFNAYNWKFSKQINAIQFNMFTFIE